MDWSQFCKKVSVCSNSALPCYYHWEVSGQLKCPFLCFPSFYSVLCFPVQASVKLHVGVLGSWWLGDLGATLTALLLPFVHSGASIPTHFPTSSIHTKLLKSSASVTLKVTAWIYKWSVTVAGTGTWSVILTGCVEERCCTWGLSEEGGIANLTSGKARHCCSSGNPSRFRIGIPMPGMCVWASLGPTEVTVFDEGVPTQIAYESAFIAPFISLTWLSRMYKGWRISFASSTGS